MAQGDGASTFTSLATSIVSAAQRGSVDVPDVIRALGSLSFDEIAVDSQFTPPYSVAPWAPGDGQPGSPSSPLVSGLGSYVRPRVRLMRGGQVLATFAPYGEPSGSWLPNAVGVAGGIAALTALLLQRKDFAWKAGAVSLGGFLLGYMTRPKVAA